MLNIRLIKLINSMNKFDCFRGFFVVGLLCCCFVVLLNIDKASAWIVLLKCKARSIYSLDIVFTNVNTPSCPEKFLTFFGFFYPCSSEI